MKLVASLPEPSAATVAKTAAKSAVTMAKDEFKDTLRTL
jgi:hypothetical protein